MEGLHLIDGDCAKSDHLLKLTLAFLSAFAVSSALTPLCRALAARTKRYSHPSADGSIPIPPFGGLAILSGILVIPLIFSITLPSGFWLGIIGMAAMGFLDDLRPFSPFQKLTLQFFVVILSVWLGIRFELTGTDVGDGVLTVLWLVWMCNAFNVLDMMDGLSAGIGAIASLGLGIMLSIGAIQNGLVVGLALAGGLFGFLCYNFHPARIYMGDSGSLLVGFALATMVVYATKVLPAPQGIIGPFLAVGIPCFEGTFLSVIRARKKRPIMQASQDHVAQRLVRLGYSINGAVARMYGVGALLSLSGIVALSMGERASWVISILVLIFALWISKRLASVDME